MTPTGSGAGSRNLESRGWVRAALAVFVAVLIGALVFLLLVGRYRWFFLDEWDFLAGRDGGDVENLLIPHNEHLSTLPIVTYRVLFNIFGLESYLPYRGLLVVLHLAAAVLLRMVMRRAGVGAWMATAAASVFVLFGSGYANLTRAFQIGFVGSLVFGLVHLLLADHDGPVDRRDWFALGAGLAGLLSSGVALTMIPVVGLATLARRGWRVALLHTAPLGGIYAIWLVNFRDRRTAQGAGYPNHTRSSPGELIRFVWNGVEGGLDAIGQLPGVAWGLGVLLLVGLALAWGRLGSTGVRTQAAPTMALLAGALVFLTFSGVVRAADFGAAYARQSRYLYLFAALVLPALALAADAVARRWRALAPVALVVLLIGIPGNVDVLLDRRRAEMEAQFAYRRLILTLPRAPLAQDMPRSMRPESRHAKPVTLGWLLDESAAGRIPAPARSNSADEATATVHLALQQRPASQDTRECHNVSTPTIIQLSKSEAITMDGIIEVVYIASEGAKSRPVRFDPTNIVVTPWGAFAGRRLVALTGPLTLRVASVTPNASVAVCNQEDDGVL